MNIDKLIIAAKEIDRLATIQKERTIAFSKAG